DGKNKAWSDEVSRLMQQIRLVIAGMATMFDPKRASGDNIGDIGDTDSVDADGDEDMMVDDDDALGEGAEDEELRPQFRYKAGYILKADDPAYNRVHELRDELGHLLTKAHAFLNEKQEDDVNCFTALCSAY